jgi:hypothetical protein
MATSSLGDCQQGKETASGIWEEALCLNREDGSPLKLMLLRSFHSPARVSFFRESSCFLSRGYHEALRIHVEEAWWSRNKYSGLDMPNLNLSTISRTRIWN